ncbi:MAG: hypothetical protein OXF02_03475 [Simkaniaceae bacterium]|nr:hypothetical protein [Simkaniaceae bacterium]
MASAVGEMCVRPSDPNGGGCPLGGPHPSDSRNPRARKGTGAEREALRKRVVDLLVKSPGVSPPDLLPAGVSETSARRWLNEVYRNEKGSFKIPPGKRKVVSIRKVLNAIRRGHVPDPDNLTEFHYRDSVVYSKRITSEQKARAVRYCTRLPLQSYELCVRDITRDPDILGGATVSSRSLRDYVRTAYEQHPRRIEVPEDLVGKVNYRQMLVTLYAEQPIDESFRSYLSCPKPGKSCNPATKAKHRGSLRAT